MKKINVKHVKERFAFINSTIYFDEKEYLREKTSDSSMISDLINHTESYLNEDTTLSMEDLFFLYGMLGNLYRIVNQPIKAIDILEKCMVMAKDDAAKKIVTLIRLGEALKYKGEHEKALHHFDEAISLCRQNQVNSYMDFALQHKGKCLIEIGMFNEAEQCLKSALHIRMVKRNDSLISSTKAAIRLIGKILADKERSN
ncbi:tetratricopeptide repeat protein [Bacillus timonensis]|nr:tetratricopeptide repeat protein [Bacillus timonensis]